MAALALSAVCLGGQEDRFLGKPAPEFELTVLGAKGKTLKLSALKGKAVVLNFWATWCEPCKVEMPWLVELQKQYGPQGLQILGIALDDADEETIATFAKKMGVNYPLLIGTERVADLYGGVDGLPMTFIVDKRGRITEHHLGLKSLETTEEMIKRLLAQ